MESVKRLDRVFPFNAKLSFLISHEWTEEYASGTLKYQEPGAKSGCLRVSLITSGTLNESACGYLKNSYAKKTNVTVEEKTGNLVSFYEKDVEEDGVPIRLTTGRLRTALQLTGCGKRCSPTPFFGPW